MADGTAPAPGDVQIDLAALSSDDIGQAGDALAGLFPDLRNTPEIQQEVNDDQPADAEAEETLPIGEDETGHSEPGTAPAIEPPVSWTAEEKQLFTQLPPELRQTLARRESERERLTQTQANEAGERAKGLEAERTQLATVRAQQVNLAGALLLQLYPELERFQKTDWETLARERPAEWAQQRQAFDGLQVRIGTAQRQLADIQQQQQTDQAAQQQTFLKEQQKLLLEREPAFGDALKSKALRDDLVKFLPEVTTEELGAISDHRHLLIARDAMLYRKAVAARAEALAKKVPGAQPQPKQRLAPAPRRSGSAGEEAQARQIAGLHENLRNSGRIQDAASLMAASGMFGKPN